MYEAAEKYLKEGDEELSYIFFMRYFDLINQIRNTEDYSKEKQYITQMLGGKSRQLAAMDKAEVLSKSLEKRYEKLAAKESETLLKTTDTDSLNNQIKTDEYKDGQSDSMLNCENDIENFSKPLTTNTCEELYKMTQDPKASLLIMDCRPQKDFESSRLHYPHCVNIPQDIIKDG